MVVGVLSSEGGLINVIGSLKVGLIELQLVLKSAVAYLIHGFVDKVRHNFADDLGRFIDADHVIALVHDLFIVALLSGPEVLNLVDFAEKSDGFKEFVCGASLLRFEEREPENLRVLSAK